MKTQTNSKKEALKLVNKAWIELDYLLSSIHWGHYGKEYIKLNIEEEKGHDRFRPEGTSRGLTIKEAAKLFCVTQIADYLLNKRKLDVSDYLSTRKSHFFACALVANYRKEIENAWKGLDIETISNLDYAELIK